MAKGEVGGMELLIAEGLDGLGRWCGLSVFFVFCMKWCELDCCLKSIAL